MSFPIKCTDCGRTYDSRAQHPVCPHDTVPIPTTSTAAGTGSYYQPAGFSMRASSPTPLEREVLDPKLVAAASWRPEFQVGRWVRCRSNDGECLGRIEKPPTNPMYAGMLLVTFANDDDGTFWPSECTPALPRVGEWWQHSTCATRNHRQFLWDEWHSRNIERFDDRVCLTDGCLVPVNFGWGEFEGLPLIYGTPGAAVGAVPSADNAAMHSRPVEESPWANGNDGAIDLKQPVETQEGLEALIKDPLVFGDAVVEDHDPLIVPAPMFDQVFLDPCRKSPVGAEIQCRRLHAEGLVTAYHEKQRRFWVRGDPKLARTRRAWTLARGLHLVPEE